MECILTIIGCDDLTRFELNLNDLEYKLLKKISAKSKEISKSNCQPIFNISKNKLIDNDLNCDCDQCFQDIFKHNKIFKCSCNSIVCQECFKKDGYCLNCKEYF